MTDEEVAQKYKSVLAAGIDKPGSIAYELKQNHLELRQAARDALDCISRDTWPVDDREQLEDLLSKLLNK